MATDCYTLFKTTYNQAIIDGMSSGAAISAANAAMAACLATQNARTSTIATPFVNTTPGRILDAGPTTPPVKR